MADKPATTVNTTPPAVVENVPVVVPAEDYEAILVKKDEEIANWKAAALKFKGKSKPGSSDPDEDEDDKISRKVEEALANSSLAKAQAEKDALIASMARQLKEAKLALLNKPGVPASTGSSNEVTSQVRDTLVTPEQLAFFKSKGWDDKTIENYKKNLLRGGR